MGSGIQENFSGVWIKVSHEAFSTIEAQVSGGFAEARQATFKLFLNMDIGTRSEFLAS